MRAGVNTYAFVGQNPLARSDSRGLFFDGGVTESVAVVAGGATAATVAAAACVIACPVAAYACTNIMLRTFKTGLRNTLAIRRPTKKVSTIRTVQTTTTTASGDNRNSLPGEVV